MKIVTVVLMALLLSLSALTGEDLKHGPDSEIHEDVPRGKVEQQPKWHSKIYPGTERDWWIYVPAQYDPKTPANVMVFQDGGGPVSEKGEMRAPIVFDNLIHKKEMPVTIGIFINSGTLPPADLTEILKAEARIQDEIKAFVAAAVKKGKTKEEAQTEAEKTISKTAPRQARQNRAFEYDSVGDRYARFLIEEILPEVEKKYNLTKDPAGRGICGQSSGGSCAFTVAWERPDVFGKVVSGIGSFTSLHGCNAYPDLIRKMEPKPIRIYMQDGDHDLDIYAGSWWHANMDMAAAFRFMGYDYFFLQGHDGHSGKQLGVNFPDAMRWLWRNDPVEGKRPEGVDNRGVFEVLVKGEGWRKAADGVGKGITSATADDAGNVYFMDWDGADNEKKSIRKIGVDGTASVFSTNLGSAHQLGCGPDGKLYATDFNQIVAIEADGKKSVRVELPNRSWIGSWTINHKGEIFCISGDSRTKLLTFANGKLVKESEISEEFDGNQLILTPDQGFLISVSDHRWEIYSARVGADGSVSHCEPFYTLQPLEGQRVSTAMGVAVDDKGRLYVSSINGIQIFDQGGRVIGILTLPERNIVKALCFGGANFDTLYTVTEKGIYARKLNAHGVRSCKPPVTVTPPRM